MDAVFTMAIGCHATMVVASISSSFIVDNWPATGGLSIKRQQPWDIVELRTMPAGRYARNRVDLKRFDRGSSLAWTGHAVE